MNNELVHVVETFSQDEIAHRVKEIGEAIRRESRDEDVLLVAILKGSAVLLGDLLRAIPGRVDFAWVDVIRGMSDTDVAEALEIDFFTHFALRRRNVYILKDVVTSGVIESYLLPQFRLREPAALSLVALIDRPDLRTVDLAVDHRLFEASEGRFVGYGMDLEGRFANLPYIGTVRAGAAPKP